MALAKYAEDIALKIDVNASALQEPPTHPTILQSRLRIAGRTSSKKAKDRKPAPLARKRIAKPSKEERLNSALRAAKIKVPDMIKWIANLEKQNDALVAHGRILSAKVTEIEQQLRVRHAVLTIREH